MTYRELLARLMRLTEEQLDQTATIQTGQDEYEAIRATYKTIHGDILDADHFVLSTAAYEQFGSP